MIQIITQPTETSKTFFQDELILSSFEENLSDISNKVFQLTNSPAATRLYVNLLKQYCVTNKYSPFIKKPIAYLAKLADCSVRTVQRAQKKLEKLGLMSISRAIVRSRQNDLNQIMLKDSEHIKLKEVISTFSEIKKRYYQEAAVKLPKIFKIKPRVTHMLINNRKNKDCIYEMREKIGSDSSLYKDIVSQWASKMIETWGEKYEYINGKLSFLNRLQGTEYIKDIESYLKKVTEKLGFEVSLKHYMQKKENGKRPTPIGSPKKRWVEYTKPSMMHFSSVASAVASVAKKCQKWDPITEKEHKIIDTCGKIAVKLRNKHKPKSHGKMKMLVVSENEIKFNVLPLEMPNSWNENMYQKFRDHSHSFQPVSVQQDDRPLFDEYIQNSIDKFAMEELERQGKKRPVDDYERMTYNIDLGEMRKNINEMMKKDPDFKYERSYSEFSRIMIENRFSAELAFKHCGVKKSIDEFCLRMTP